MIPATACTDFRAAGTAAAMAMSSGDPPSRAVSPPIVPDSRASLPALPVSDLAGILLIPPKIAPRAAP